MELESIKRMMIHLNESDFDVHLCLNSVDRLNEQIDVEYQLIQARYQNTDLVLSELHLPASFPLPLLKDAFP